MTPFWFYKGIRALALLLPIMDAVIGLICFCIGFYGRGTFPDASGIDTRGAM